MKKCIWLKPKLVAAVEYAEWTPAESPAPYEIHGFGKTKIRNRWTGMAGAVIKIPRIFCGQFGSEV
jgi:hypothetical protein